MNLCTGLYFFNLAVFFHSAKLIAVLAITSGVLQGCPLPAYLFDLAVDPLLRAMVAKLHGVGRLRACADYFAASLSRLIDLSRLLPIFRTALACAGLRLDASKCVLIPCAIPLTAHVTDMIRN